MTGAVEPIAVIGIGCRFPGGVGTPESFWDLLISGQDASGPAPDERWQWYRRVSPAHDLAVQRTIPRGSFLDDVAGFDAEFFGVSGREAELMDPQQRILLETSWEALEHAGVPPRSLGGGETGVYVGVCTEDYGRRLLEDLPGIEAWTGIGAAGCALANRISYALDLRGPSMTVDTACSASLVSLHLACQGLRTGDCTTALAAGVNLIVSPGETLSLDAAGALSPDGRSRPFDAGADGYGRGEGCGVLVLRRLADARRDGDTVLAVVLGSSVNQDGRTNGIMAPSGTAQEHVMRRACMTAGIDPATVGFVEAHGTGTRLGDPEEVAALSAVYGTGREPGEPCLIGSVKGNIGHLEGAAGVAGLIRAVLALQRAEVPPSVIRRLNPDIPWGSNGLRVAAERVTWPAVRHPRRAAVSGFGYGGAIAHIVLEQAPEQESVVMDGSAVPRLYPLSAGSPEALAGFAGKLADRLEDDSVALASAGHTLALRRSHLGHRAVLVAARRDELREQLRDLAAGRPRDGVVTGQPLGTGERPVWVFSGHGSQWSGMGRELLTAEPAFATTIAAIEPIFAEMGFSLPDALRDGDLGGVDCTQALIFAMQVGLAAVWRSYGVSPSAVIGHSVGEIAAAVACGALSLAEGARLACRRSVLLRRVAGQGAMAMIGLPFDEVEERLADRPGVVPAIISAPSSTVVSGDPAGVAAFAEQCRRAGVMVRAIDSDVAFHSPQMEPLVATLEGDAADLTPRAPAIPMYRTALPDPRSAAALDRFYWGRNLRDPVRLRTAVAAAAADGHRAFLEISPHPVVAHSISECLAGSSVEDVFVGWTLRRGRSEPQEFLSALGTAHCHGVRVAWAQAQPAGGLVTLPCTPWRHRPYWREPTAIVGGGAQGHDIATHTLLGGRTTVAGSEVVTWRTWLDDAGRPYPGRHIVHLTEIVPAAVLVCTFLDAVPGSTLTDLVMSRPLLTAERREIQVVREGQQLRLASRAAGSGADAEWLVHAEAGIPDEERRRVVHPAPNTNALEPLEPDYVQQRLATVGVPSTGFEWVIEELTGGPGRLHARVSGVAATGAALTWASILDAVMTVAPAVFDGDPELRMVVRADRVEVIGSPSETFVVDATLDEARPDTVDVVVFTGDGRHMAAVTGLRYPVFGSDAAADQLIHQFVWRPLDLPRLGANQREVALIGPDCPLLDAVGGALTAAGLAWRAAARLSDVGPTTTITDVVVVPRSTPGTDDGALIGQAAAAAGLLAETAAEMSSAKAVARLWCVTVGVRECLDRTSLAQASLWGVARALSAEPGTPMVTIVDGDLYDRSWTRLLPALLTAGAADSHLAIRAGSVEGARLVPATMRHQVEPVRCRRDGTYLVFGGLGDLGLTAARELAARGARRLVLADDRPFPSRGHWGQAIDLADRRRIEAIRSLEEQGIAVRVLGLDCENNHSVAWFDPSELDLPPVRGVIHASEPALPADGLDQTVAAVVNRALRLNAQFPVGSLDFLVLYSSANALAGIAGSTSAAVSCAVFEGLAGLRAVSGAGDATVLGWVDRPGQATPALTGIGTTPDEAVAAWAQAARCPPGLVTVLRGTALARVAGLSTFLSEITSPGEEPPDDAVPTAGVSPEQLREHVLHEVRVQIAAELRMDESSLGHRRPLVEQGLDSVMSVMVRRRLEKRFGHALPVTLLWQQPTVSAIADHLVELLREDGGDEPRNTAVGAA